MTVQNLFITFSIKNIRSFTPSQKIFRIKKVIMIVKLKRKSTLSISRLVGREKKLLNITDFIFTIDELRSLNIISVECQPSCSFPLFPSTNYSFHPSLYQYPSSNEEDYDCKQTTKQGSLKTVNCLTLYIFQILISDSKIVCFRDTF